MKKLLSILLSIITVVSVLSITQISSFAATINTKYPQNIKGYTLSSASKSAVVYSDSSCKKSIGYVYGTDDCTITAIYTNNIVRVVVPWSGYANGRTCYAKLSDFWSTSYSVKKLTAKIKSTAYSRKDLKKSLGYVYVNDTCFIIGESGNYYQALVPWSGGYYRICWVSKSAFNNSGNGTASTSSFSPVWPAKNARYISTLYRYYNSGSPRDHATRSNKFNAIDIAGTSGDSILAVESGVVRDKGYQSGGFGYYIVLQHSNNLYSLYGHLKSSAIPSVGSKVSKNQVIGYMGSTGSSSGTHLHFEMYNPNNYSAVINPWATYYQGKISGITIGGNSYKANIKYNDSTSQAYCKWLKNNCKINASGDYVFTK